MHGRRHARIASVVAIGVLPLALAACSSSGSTTPTTSPSSSASDTPSPSVSPTDTPTPTPTPSPSDSVSPSVSPSTSPSVITPSPTGSLLGITVSYAPTTAAKSQKVAIVATTDASLAGKTVYIVKTNDGAPKVLGTGSVIGSKGVAKTYAQLLRTGVLELVVPVSPLTTGPFDPATPLLAQSAPFTVTIA